MVVRSQGVEVGFSGTKKTLAANQAQHYKDMGFEKFSFKKRTRRPVGDQRVCKAEECKLAAQYAGYCMKHFDAEIRRREGVA